MVYRIKHIPTGMFFIPSRNVRLRGNPMGTVTYTKSNLSTAGKLYARKPTLKYLGRVYYNHLAWTVGDGWRPVTLPVIESEWVIEELN